MICLIYINGRNNDIVLNTAGNHSIFQDIIALNIPYCSDFYIIAESSIFVNIKKQMQVFQSITFKLFNYSGSDKKNALDSIYRIVKEKTYVLDADDFTNIIRMAEDAPDVYKEWIIKCKSSSEKVNRSNFAMSFDINSYHTDRNVRDSESLIKLSPAFKDYLWGGTKLREIFGKKGDFDIIAESWELSAHPDGQSIIAGGKYNGMKFGDYLNTIGKDALGWKCRFLADFPLLVKLIDAKGNLSVQVHPDDEYALEYENQYGKNEMWYVIDSEPGAGLYVGFNKNISREEVEERVKNNSIMNVLNFFPTKPGDVFFIPARTVHAIGAGNLICEIQQSSNCTYRLYDYDRRDKFGNLRELHLEKALDVLNFNKYESQSFDKEADEDGLVLVRCKYFESILYEVTEEICIKLENTSFYSVICIGGQGQLQIGESEMEIRAGESVFIPVQKKILVISGDLSVIISHL